MNEEMKAIRRMLPRAEILVQLAEEAEATLREVKKDG